MKRLVLLGEGHGEETALPVLIGKILRDKGLDHNFFPDKDVIRTAPTKLVKWDKQKRANDFALWHSRIEIALKRRNVGGILAVYDGDLPKFPVSSTTPFCACAAARTMANSAREMGAGQRFSLSIVFAKTEYETWLIAGVESLAGQKLPDGRLALPSNTCFPGGDAESHGKYWLEKIIDYNPPRDQAALTKLVNLETVRSKNLRSFRRLENAVEQLTEAAMTGKHISTPD